MGLTVAELPSVLHRGGNAAITLLSVCGEEEEAAAGSVAERPGHRGTCVGRARRKLGREGQPRVRFGAKRQLVCASTLRLCRRVRFGWSLGCLVLFKSREKLHDYQPPNVFWVFFGDSGLLENSPTTKLTMCTAPRSARTARRAPLCPARFARPAAPAAPAPGVSHSGLLSKRRHLPDRAQRGGSPAPEGLLCLRAQPGARKAAPLVPARPSPANARVPPAGLPRLAAAGPQSRRCRGRR